MRAFYTDSNGHTADLCNYLYMDTTRLTVRDRSGSVIFSKEFSNWSSAKDALRMHGADWTNDLTNEQI